MLTLLISDTSLTVFIITSFQSYPKPLRYERVNTQISLLLKRKSFFIVPKILTSYISKKQRRFLFAAFDLLHINNMPFIRILSIDNYVYSRILSASARSILFTLRVRSLLTIPYKTSTLKNIPAYICQEKARLIPQATPDTI